MSEQSWPPSATLLAITGILLIGSGLYFMLLRPSLLPEDIRFMPMPAGKLDAIRSQLGM